MRRRCASTSKESDVLFPLAESRIGDEQVRGQRV
jgi:hypothetical protein